MDFAAVCRTCLGTESLSPIFLKNDLERHSANILITTGIKVEPHDRLPQQMCTDCVRYINKSLSFRNRCKESATKLLQLLQEDKSTQNKRVSKKIKYESGTLLAETVKVDDILKVEPKCEYEIEADSCIKPEVESVENEEGIKSEGESDLENEIPLNQLTLRSRQNEEEKKETSNIQEKSEENLKIQNKKRMVQRVRCPVCDKDLSARSLRAHLRIKHGPERRCAYCDTEHASEAARAAHAASCPRKRRRRVCETGKELVSCEVCHKAMQRASLRAHHAVKHKGLGPVCEHCGRRFGNKLRLSEHLRARHGHAKLRCALCDFQSSSRAALQNHERRHRGEKPYVCETCGAKFHAAYLLAQHRHNHRTDKRVKCSLCGALFKSANGLHSHRLARHGARRHRCALCARAYSCRHYAVKHMRAVHGYKGTVPPLQVEPAPS